MSDNFLSQAEIDALLKQGVPSSTGTETNKSVEVVLKKTSEVLRQFANTTVSTGEAKPEEGSLTKLVPDLAGMVVAPLVFSPTGRCLLALDEEVAGKIAATVMGQDPAEVTGIDDMGLSVFGEAFSQIAGAISTAAAQESGQTVTFDPPMPRVFDGDQSFLAEVFDSEIAAFKSQITVGDFEPADLWVLFDEDFQAYWGEGVVEAAAAAATATATAPNHVPVTTPPRPQTTSLRQSAPSSLSNEVNIKKAVFSPLEPVDSGQMQNINLLLDVPLEVTVELGRTKMQIKEILELGKGSLIELSKLAGEPVDIVVNGKLLAKGEVVVIDETFGVKIVDIVSPVERVNSLQ
ncbi:MAG: flagellar motor switch protein FliN [Firmicutes bacterium]|nr:flagellar motor switch protein FliN [Bacillota bacterium]